MVDAQDVLGKLNSATDEIERLAGVLDDIENKLEGVQMRYDEFMGAYEEGMWNNHVMSGAKFPPEKLRERMGRRAMPPELLGEFVGLTNRRRRLKDRISSLKASIEGRRSVLSAAKEGIV